MPYSVSQLVEMVKLPTKTMFILSLFLGTLLFLSSSTLERLGISGVIGNIRPLLAMAFLFFSIAIFVDFLITAIAFLKPWIVQQFFVERPGKKFLQKLTTEERSLLSEAVNNNSRIVRIHINDGNARHLVHYRVISKAANSAYSHDPCFEYCINPWAWEYLERHAELIEKS